MQPSQLAINSVSTRRQGQPQGLVEALDAYSAAGFRNVEFVLALIKDWMRRDLLSLWPAVQNLEPAKRFEDHY